MKKWLEYESFEYESRLDPSLLDSDDAQGRPLRQHKNPTARTNPDEPGGRTQRETSRPFSAALARPCAAPPPPMEHSRHSSS